MRHLGRDRVFDPKRICPTTKEARGFGVNEAVGHAFIIPKCCNRAPRCALFDLQSRQNGARHACVHAGQGPALQFGERGDARHFLDQIRLAQNIGAPCGRGGHIAVQSKTQIFQRLALHGFGNIHAHKRYQTRRI